MEIWYKVVAWLIFVIQLLLYPIHFLFRVLARILLIVLTTGFVPLLLSLVAYVWVCAWMWLQTGIWKQLDGIAETIGLITLLSGMGLLANFLKQKGETIKKSLRDIFGIARSVVVNGAWIPGLDVEESLTRTRDENFSPIRSSVKEMSVASWQFVKASSLFLTVSMFAYLPIKDIKDWQDRIEDKVEQLSPATVTDTVTDTAEDVQCLFEKNKTFVLAHVEDADVKSRAGICLDAGRQEWLAEFKKAIEHCADSGQRPELEVRAFSSTVPMALGDRVTPQGSALANCEVANQRAEAVVEFLLGRPEDRWACGSGGRVAVGSFENGGGGLCQRLDGDGKADDEFTYGEEDGLKFDLSYRPWRTHAAMTAEKPADNGVLQGPRRYDAEFLNRAVYITLKNDVCKKTEN